MVIISRFMFHYMEWQQQLFEYAKMRYATWYVAMLERKTLLAETRLDEEKWVERLQYCVCYDNDDNFTDSEDESGWTNISIGT